MFAYIENKEKKNREVKKTIYQLRNFPEKGEIFLYADSQTKERKV